MTINLKKKPGKMTFDELRIEKERLKNRVLKEEHAISDLYSDLVSGFSFKGIGNELLDIMVRQPETIVRTGIITYNLIRGLRSRKS